jgi:hypothetical protein
MNLVANTAVLALLAVALPCWPGQDAAFARPMRNAMEMAQAATGAQVTGEQISDAEVEQTIAVWAKRMNMRPEQLIEVYTRSGKSAGELKQHIRSHLAEQKRRQRSRVPQTVE